ncbi:flagellar basal-body MS-ring/collar protein FliF [Nocardioides sp.]|uniref:flagellar basal-body MS-ring/collar protein FliF n=1 Tax=Nocardioides sp. TaxID=35761 RepID=UPI003517B4CD
MQQRLNGVLVRARDSFAAFTAGQKAVALVGGAALLIAAFLVFRWVSAPSYAPLYSNLSGEDASAVVDQLDSQGVPYKLAGGGNTIMVPRNDVYSARIALSGKGLPASSDGGYSILDKQSLSTSESQERTNFKRAMEGELAKTIESIDGVNTAVVHLAIPEKQVFSDTQDPTTASVLVATAPGTDLGDEQVQAVVHLVASSIDGLDPKNVTVADSTGRVLNSSGVDGGAAAVTAQTKQIQGYQDAMKSQIQAVLDRVVGPGNATATVTADLSFDKAVTKTRTYSQPKAVPPLSETTTTERYNGPASGANSAVGGVVGPDGQMDPAAAGAGGNGPSTYTNGTTTRDNAVDETVESREKAPGSVNSLHVGVVLDATAAAAIQPQVIKNLISSAVGIQPDRGDTIDVSALPFDRSAEKADAAAIKAAQDAEAAAAKTTLYRNAGIGGAIALMVLLAWLQARRRAKARAEAANYLVEQLRLEQANRATPEIESPALQALESAEANEEEAVRAELMALVDRQPDDVASLLRGWLVEPRP